MFTLQFVNPNAVNDNCREICSPMQTTPVDDLESSIAKEDASLNAERGRLERVKGFKINVKQWVTTAEKNNCCDTCQRAFNADEQKEFLELMVQPFSHSYLTLSVQVRPEKLPKTCLMTNRKSVFKPECALNGKANKWSDAIKSRSISKSSME